MERVVKKIIIFLCALNFCSSFSQENDNINLIISIDEKVPTSLNIKNISYSDTDGKTYENNDLKYTQGNFSVPKTTFDKLMSDGVKNVYLSLEYWEYCKGEQKNYSYVIELENSYFKYEYLIMHLFNLDKKKYRKIYFPISDNKNYTYYFDYPSNFKGRLIQRRLTKEQKKCNK